MRGLTKRQREIVDFIKDFIRKRHYSPSYREIMAHFGFTSLGSVYKHIGVLKRKGVISAEKNSARSVVVNDMDREESDPRTVDLPFMGYIAAGYPIETFPQAGTISVPADLVANKPNSYVLQVRGESMVEAGILPGDMIIVESCQEEPADGKTVVALIHRSETTLKRYFRDGDRIRLEPSNASFEPIWVDRQDIEVQGVLTGSFRRYG